MAGVTREGKRRILERTLASEQLHRAALALPADRVDHFGRKPRDYAKRTATDTLVITRE